MAEPKVINIEFPNVLPSLHMTKCPKCGSSQAIITGVKGVMSKNVTAGAAAGVGGAIGVIVHDAIDKSRQDSKPSIPLSTIRFLCEGCGEKFETEPHMTDEADILEEPFSVTFTRKASMLEDINFIFINGVFLSNTPQNMTVITFKTNVRNNILFSVGTAGKTVTNGVYTFQAVPGGSLSLLYTKKQFNIVT